MRYINADGHFRVLSIAPWCPWHEMSESFRIRQAVGKVIEGSDNKVAVLAGGSLSHRIHDNHAAPAGILAARKF